MQLPTSNSMCTCSLVTKADKTESKDYKDYVVKITCFQILPAFFELFSVYSLLQNFMVIIL